MKKLINLFFATIVTISYSQDIPKVEITSEGISSIVVEIEGKTASELYQKTLNWIQQVYKNPDEVLKANIKDEMVRFDGFDKSVWSAKVMGLKSSYDVAYTIEIDFKDGKYRFKWNTREFWVSESSTRAAFTESAFFKKDGSVRNDYVDGKAEYEATINAMNRLLYNYISGKADKKNDDW